jgi:hypothetical protein
MATPDPEELSLLAKVIAAGVAVIAPAWGAWTWLDKRFEKKADKHQVNNALQKIENEMTIQRGNVGKLFDQIRDSDQRAQDRHERLMEKIAERRS